MSARHGAALALALLAPAGAALAPVAATRPVARSTAVNENSLLLIGRPVSTLPTCSTVSAVPWCA